MPGTRGQPSSGAHHPLSRRSAALICRVWLCNSVSHRDSVAKVAALRLDELPLHGGRLYGHSVAAPARLSTLCTHPGLCSLEWHAMSAWQATPCMAREAFLLSERRLACNGAANDRLLLTADCPGKVSHPDTELSFQCILRKFAVQAGCSNNTAGVATLRGGNSVRMVDVHIACRVGCVLLAPYTCV